MKETFTMSREDCRRQAALEQVCRGALTLKDAAEEIDVSYRHAKRLLKRYREGGPGALAHRSRDQLSPRRFGAELKARVLELCQGRYAGFGPTLACEYLAEEQKIRLSRETLRQWMIGAHLWQPGKRRCRRRRERRERFGQLVQFDGSLHRWFEARGAPCCVMVMIDDATGWCEIFFASGETLEAAFSVLRRWIERHGGPEALYVDARNMYVGNDGSQRTDFARACEELGIRLIVARSAQAKGRVERRNALLQDRLVKHLRLAGIDDVETANQQTEAFMARLNARFTVTAASAVDAHRQAPPARLLDGILCREEARRVDRDGTISIASERWSLRPDPPPGARVRVRLRAASHPLALHDGRTFECLPASAPQATRPPPACGNAAP